ncbi:beta strand repeat-containing protein, partial [Planktothrix mougeotii]
PVDTTNEDTQVELTFADLAAQGNEADSDGTVDAFVVKAVSSGTLKIGSSAASATAWVAGSNDRIDVTKKAYWTPNANVNGTVNAVQVIAKDNDGLESATPITVKVAVTAVNDAPTAADKTLTVDIDGSHNSFTVADFGFSDVDTTDTLASIKITQLPTAGTLKLSNSNVSLNQVITAVDIPNLRFNPVAGANGLGYANFKFKVNDGKTDSLAANKITIDVIAINDVPTAADKTLTINEEGSHSFTVADFGFSDLDTTDTLKSIKITQLATAGTLKLSNSNVSLNQVITAVDIPNLRFTPVPGANGLGYANFKFKVNDGTIDSVVANTITIDVTAVNDAPLLANFTYNGLTTINEDDSNSSGDIVGNMIPATIIQENTNVSLTGVYAGSVTTADFDKDGDTDILLTGFDGSKNPISQIYTNNGSGGFSQNTNVSLTGVVKGSVTTADFDNDGDTDILLTGLDGSSLISKIYNNNGSGGFSQNTNVSLTGVAASSVTTADFDKDGDTDILLTGFDGSSIISQIYNNNGSGGFSQNTNVSLPGVYYGSVTTADFDNDGNTDILLTGVDGSSIISKIYTNPIPISDVDTTTILKAIAITATDNNGTWQYSTNNGTTWTNFPTVSNSNALLLDAGNKVRFQPNANYNGTIPNALTFRAWDKSTGTAGSTADTTTNGGTTAFSVNTASASITVMAVNDAPTATDKTVTFNEDSSYTFAAADFGFSDVDTGNTLASIKITQLPTVGTLELNGAAVTADQVIIAANIPNLKFTSVADANGSGYANFKFTVNDGTIDSLAANTITIDVTAVNDAPTATDKTLTVDIDGSHNSFMATDFGFSDVDTTDTLASIKIIQLPTVGTLQLNNSNVSLNQVITAVDIPNLRFNPVAGANGLGYANFKFTVNDGTIDSVAANTITIDVLAVNDLPTGNVSITGTATQNQTLTATNTVGDIDGLGTLNYQWQES